MKKTSTILLALMVLCFTQCKPVTESGNENTRKVKVSCTLHINGDGKSEFDNIMTYGKIKWSEGTERIYLAIPETQQIVELVSDEHQGNVDVLTFNGTVDESVLNDGTYEIWYFGKQVPNINETDGVINSISGSIATQTGNLSDLGNFHIAKATVTAETNGEEIVLSLNSSLRSQMAIAYLDLTGISYLKGEAIVGTDYTFQYNEAKNEFEFVVEESDAANIEITDGTETSYVVLFPNGDSGIDLKSNISKKVTFTYGIKANWIYYRAVSEVEYYPLVWTDYEELYSQTTITVNDVSFTMIGVEGNNSLSDYYIGETEVTYELWSAVMGSNPGDFTGDPERPVVQVSWIDSQSFITQLNELTGSNFMLPTNAEWEYAAKGGNKSHNYTYSGSENVDEVAWYKDNSGGETHVVKTKFPNELGIYDMSGNVQEWTNDEDGAYRFFYGGSYKVDSKFCKVTHSDIQIKIGVSDDIGFRLCRHVLD